MNDILLPWKIHGLYIVKTTNGMNKMKQDAILHFYRILENSLHESDISKINEGDIDAWSQSFKKVVRESKEKGGKGVFVPFLMWRLGEISPVEANNYLDRRKHDECFVSYDHNNVEYVVWVMALMFMSWSITNLKRKTQNGHCQNVNHSHGDTNPRLCQEGAKFHQDLYNECIKTFGDLLVQVDSLENH
jgi:hypothetical protein